MDARAAEIAAVLLREGALRTTDAEHREIRQELLGNKDLFDEVERRLDAVGFELVQRLGHIGVAVARRIAPVLGDRNRMGLDARHLRLIVYLWTHLVYREWTDLRYQRETSPPGVEQTALFEVPDEDDAPCMSYAAVRNELAEVMSSAQFKGVLNRLRRWRFVRYDEKRDRIWADAALYTHLDLARMEDFVVDLARRLGADDAGEGVTRVVTGSRVAQTDLDVA